MDIVIAAIVLLFLYVFLCYIIAKIGEKRHIGFYNAFILSFILSPLMGYIITVLTRRIKSEYDQEMLEIQKAQKEVLDYLKSKSNSQTSIDNILNEDKTITEE